MLDRSILVLVAWDAGSRSHLVKKSEVRRASPDEAFFCVQNQNLCGQPQSGLLASRSKMKIRDHRAKYEAEEEVCGPNVPMQEPDIKKTVGGRGLKGI